MLALVLTACGASSTIEAALPDISALSSTDQALVRFEAQWLCDVQRHAYSDLSDMDAARSQLMNGFGVAPATYDDFKLQLESDGELRGHVSDAYMFNCGS